jgi:hypothetical protein
VLAPMEASGKGGEPVRAAEVWNASGVEVPFYRGWERGSGGGKGGGTTGVIATVVNGD